MAYDDDDDDDDHCRRRWFFSGLATTEKVGEAELAG